jgi:threonine synthase
MWKAFDEMQQLGWIGTERPKMISVQAAGCAPIVRAFEHGSAASQAWANAQTISAGLRVPKAYADFIILDILRKSSGTAVAVTDDETMHAFEIWAREEGVFAAPEGAASLAAYSKLCANGFLRAEDRVVLFNTGSGYKYIDVIAKYYGKNRPQLPKSRNIGGIIQPY